MVSYSPTIPAIDSMSGIPNTVEATQASLAAGRMHYQINCAVCHGDNADGQGNATRYGFPAISLQNETAKGRTDGYIFGMIRNGRGLMPPYNRIEERDRWDVINYLRALQGRVTGVPFERGPLARPGVTGEMLPGPSTLGPQRAIPYRPSSAAEGATRPGGDR
jgi:mono/diheme cytochrome c family protein